MSKVCSAREAVEIIKDGQSVASVGVIGWITPDDLLKALAERFRETGTPRDLTFYFPCGTGEAMGIKGMDHVAIPGLMKRVVSGSYINPVDHKTGRRPELMRLIRENLIEAYSWPHWGKHALAAGGRSTQPRLYHRDRAWHLYRSAADRRQVYRKS
ncbi:MAG: hypothetical protein KatS3mg123_2171 [Burkholderiales bacterium]|nr:MAG: hypothetical protein KatS3mg123_2171 [Burkholderiales bacterium]